MPSLQCERSAILLCGIVLALASTIYAQSVGPEGGEYTLSGRRVGDQTVPQIAVGPDGGYLVWQDNAIDGPGKSLGIAARKLGSQMDPLVPVFRVNQILNQPQENPRVALMKNGGGAFVWQGGKLGAQDIYFRTYSPTSGLAPQKEVVVNTYTIGQQSTPVITCLFNGNLAVAWSSLHQDKSLEGIYARIVTPAGTFASLPFRINQFTSYNQRNPAITTLSNGHFAVVWVSENRDLSALPSMRTNRAHIYARVFNKAGYAVTNEIRVNTRSEPCANPSVAPWGTRGFIVTWAEKSLNRTNGWDIYARRFSAADVPASDAIRVNDLTYGDQFAPEVACVGRHQMVVWNTFGHDGSREGVFGRIIQDGGFAGPDFLINTHTNSSQLRPVVAGCGTEFVVAWSSFMGNTSFDVRGQKYLVPEFPDVSTASGSLVIEANRLGGADPLPPLPPSPVSVTGPASDPMSGIQVVIANTTKGKRLSWNTEAGRAYQVQYSTNFSRWENVGEPRTATASSDWTPVGHGGDAGFYRVIRVE